MKLSRTGSKKNSATFKSNAAEVTPDQMRSSACKMIRTVVSLMRTLDQMPDEPEDYEPPFFKCCADNEAINIWNKNLLKMEVGNVNSKHLLLARQINTLLDPHNDSTANIEGDNKNIENECNLDENFSDTEVDLAKSFGKPCCISRSHLDSGATHHICVNKSCMKDFEAIKKQDRKTLYSADGEKFRAKEMGTIAY